ncbi:acetyl-CoA acetyltransferase [Pseudonocardia sp. C8]|uniref:acetyl-CoA acetyltransferase n=1 Tax=Pseudonocardia sp. C8 TaxID=2762759 RepID=UPI00351C196E
MAGQGVFVLGGAQTDFSRVWTREGLDAADLIREVVQDALGAARVDAGDVQVGHVGNFAGELYLGQGHLGGLLVEADPAFAGMPTSRHEAACASGSMAVLAAMADIEAGRYDVALVVGAEIMRIGRGAESQRLLAAGAWVPRETEGVEFPWPHQFNSVAMEYDRRYGLDHRYLGAIAANNLANARQNPLAQTRNWTFDDRAFAEDDEANPTMAGLLRRQDCSPITDGGAAVVLASGTAAREWAARRGRSSDGIPRISGWGHTTSRMAVADKLTDAADSPYVAPHLRRAIVDAFDRARIPDAAALDLIELHDCFSISEYLMIDHFGLTDPGESWRAVDSGAIARDGKWPINPSGGLLGVGHPVGASGVRMLLDVARQVEDAAGDCQVPGAQRGAVLNMGGSMTTTACFVVDTDGVA